MKIAVILFALLLVAAAQFVPEKPQSVRMVTIGTNAPIPPYKKRGKLKGYQRKG
jgi:hypothetical protein